MLEWFRERRHRKARDLIDAKYLIAMHGPEAIEVARGYAEAETQDDRFRRRWRRIARVVSTAIERPSQAQGR